MPLQLHAESQFEKLPSLLSYCKSKGKEAEKGVALVTTVWFPNQFPNLSIDTEKYRVRISTKGDNALEVIDFLESAIEQEQVLMVRITDAKKLAYELDILETESATWQSLGEHGRRCTVDEKKSKPRASKRSTERDS